MGVAGGHFGEAKFSKQLDGEVTQLEKYPHTFPILVPFPLTPVTPLPSGPRTAVKHVLFCDQRCSRSMDTGPGVPAREDGRRLVGGLGKPGSRWLQGVRVLPVLESSA